MVRSDAQALVAEAIAVDGALVAATLVFYAQVVSRFGGRLAARLWYSPRLVLPGAGALVITVWALYQWGTAPRVSPHASQWTAPAALAAQLVFGIVLVSGVFQTVITERLPKGVFRRLSPRRFARSGDVAADREAHFERAYDRTNAELRAFQQALSDTPPPRPPSLPRGASSKIRARVGWWWLRWTTGSSLLTVTGATRAPQSPLSTDAVSAQGHPLARLWSGYLSYERSPRNAAPGRTTWPARLA